MVDLYFHFPLNKKESTIRSRIHAFFLSWAGVIFRRLWRRRTSSSCEVPSSLRVTIVYPMTPKRQSYSAANRSYETFGSRADFRIKSTQPFRCPSLLSRSTSSSSLWIAALLVVDAVGSDAKHEHRERARITNTTNKFTTLIKPTSRLGTKPSIVNGTEVPERFIYTTRKKLCQIYYRTKCGISLSTHVLDILRVLHVW